MLTYAIYIFAITWWIYYFMKIVAMLSMKRKLKNLDTSSVSALIMSFGNLKQKEIELMEKNLETLKEIHYDQAEQLKISRDTINFLKAKDRSERRRIFMQNQNHSNS